ncbi:MAG TPA: DUF6691 family protein [Alphaproteobacteria bacterium]
MKRNLAALGAGVVFGLGLAISQMVDPAKVLAFLDLAGDWDPSLAFVMAGAVAVSFFGFRATSARVRPVLAEAFQMPKARDVDARLVGGAALFGVGWGLVGVCPGPAIAGLAFGLQESAIFVAALVVGAGVANLTLAKPLPKVPVTD